MRRSLLLIQKADQNDLIKIIGPAVRAGSWFGSTNGLHTISVHFSNFRGGFKLQGTLSTNPSGEDWFDIPFDGVDPDDNYFKLAVETPNPDPQNPGESGIHAFNIEGNFVFLRIVISREMMDPLPTEQDFVGSIDRALVSF